MNALVLCAGRGTRLGDRTLHTPKPLLPLDGVPLLERTLAWLKSAGIDNVIVNVHHAREAMALHFLRRGPREWLSFSEEPELLGTAGAAKACLKALSPDGAPAMIVYGDMLFHEVALEPFFRAIEQCPGEALIGLAWAPTLAGRSRVLREYGGRVLSFEEKPADGQQGGELFAGLLVATGPRLATLPDSVPLDFGHDVFPGWADERELYGHGLTGEAIDIGTPLAYERAERVVRSAGLAP